MKIIKKNILSIVAGVIALLAVGATFYPLSGLFDARTQDAKKRLQVYQRLESVLKQRSWPKVDLTDAPAEPLDMFPNPKIIQAGRERKEQVEEQRREMLEFSVRINRHELLTRWSLPQPRSASDALKFRQDLDTAVDELKRKVLKGGLPPTAENIQKRAAQLWHKKYEPAKMMAGPNNSDWINRSEQVAQFEAEKAGLLDLMRGEIATSCKMYLDDGAVVASEEIMKDNQTPGATSIWYAQMLLWVQQDLAANIAQVNDASDSIEAAPVKRLLEMDVTPDRTMYVQAMSGNDRPNAASGSNNPSDPLPFLVWVSPTGRVCNSLYDVVHWHLLVHVDAARVDDFLAQLESSRFICVRQVDVVGMDYDKVRSGGFSYGSAPVVQLSVDGEELFLREWTVPLMPPAVRGQLGVPATWKPSLGQ